MNKIYRLKERIEERVKLYSGRIGDCKIVEDLIEDLTGLINFANEELEDIRIKINEGIL